jgi:hypothetical protein
VAGKRNLARDGIKDLRRLHGIPLGILADASGTSGGAGPPKASSRELRNREHGRTIAK